MARGQSYNELVAKSRKALVAAAQEVHESYRHTPGVYSAHHHRACCSAMAHVAAPPLAHAHFDRMFDNGHAYYFGDNDTHRVDTNKKRQEHRVYALLLAAASIE